MLSHAPFILKSALKSVDFWRSNRQKQVDSFLWPMMYNAIYAVAPCLSVCLSVSLSVCHKPTFCRNSSMQRAGFRHRDYPGLILNYIITELGYLKNEGSFSNSEHSRFFSAFRHGTSTVACCELSSIVACSITLSVQLCLQHVSHDIEPRAVHLRQLRPLPRSCTWAA